ncbi:PRC-barrel domain-containing protein [Actinomadura madurae]|nr:PRC-barrel domain-containing protein [Actinomadura madurae]MCP9968276.1 PRC-barrel domain-containing protein [Actinomadura madurae]
METQTQVRELMGMSVTDTNGTKVGTIKQVYLNDDSGSPEWVTVHTGWFGMRESFVPLSGARKSKDALQVPYDKETIKGAPNVDADEHLSHAQIVDLYRHYGVRPPGGRRSGGETGTSEASGDRRMAGGESGEGKAAGAAGTAGTSETGTSETGTSEAGTSEAGTSKTGGTSEAGGAGGPAGAAGTAGHGGRRRDGGAPREGPARDDRAARGPGGHGQVDHGPVDHGPAAGRPDDAGAVAARGRRGPDDRDHPVRGADADRHRAARGRPRPGAQVGRDGDGRADDPGLARGAQGRPRADHRRAGRTRR